MSPLKSDTVDHDSAAFFLTNPELPGLPANSLAVRRMRLVGGGALEQLAVFNTTPKPVAFELSLACGADFADLFEIRTSVRDRSANIASSSGRRSLRFRYRVPGFLAETTVRIEGGEILESGTERVLGHAPPRIDGSDIVWKATLPPRSRLVALAAVGVRVNDVAFEPVHKRFGEQKAPFEARLTGWLEHIPDFDSESDLLNHVFRQSVVDLGALRISANCWASATYSQRPGCRGS